MAAPTKVHDPLFHFETHFPERLSRLHLHQDFSHSVRRTKKNRAARSGIRYKTQPVTFDEIQEVDEEAVEEAKSPSDGLKGQFQAFSRSMDGLLPKKQQTKKEPGRSSLSSASSGPSGAIIGLPPSGRIGSTPTSDNVAATSGPTGLPPKVPEKVSGAEQRLQEVSTETAAEEEGKKQDMLAPPGGDDSAQKSPIPSPNMAPRRQKVTAKAKKRQKAAEDGGGGEKDT